MFFKHIRIVASRGKIRKEIHRDLGAAVTITTGSDFGSWLWAEAGRNLRSMLDKALNRLLLEMRNVL